MVSSAHLSNMYQVISLHEFNSNTIIFPFHREEHREAK